MTSSARPASPISVAFDARTDTVTYTWTQYQLTTTISGKANVGPLAAMTREAAITYSQKARPILAGVDGFESMKLSMVECEYSEKLTARPDTHEDGDGSPILGSEKVSGDKWRTGRHVARNLNMEASDARKACKALQGWYRLVGC